MDHTPWTNCANCLVRHVLGKYLAYFKVGVLPCLVWEIIVLDVDCYRNIHDFKCQARDVVMTTAYNTVDRLRSRKMKRSKCNNVMTCGNSTVGTWLFTVNE